MPELDVCPVEELPPGEMKIVTAGLVSVGVYNLDGAYYAIETYAPRDQIPPGLPAGQLGYLLSKVPGGKIMHAGNITGYEKRYDPDGEGFDSDPYSVLALDNQVLVADAAADDILSVRNGHVSLVAALEEYGP